MLGNEELEIVIYNLTIHTHTCRIHGRADHIHNGFRWLCLECEPDKRPAGGVA